jgi:hypothetical protein
MNKYCNVKSCRYPTSHVTDVHLCGKCKNLGHGQLECDNPDKIKELCSFYGTSLPYTNRCTNESCNYKHTHTTESHIYTLESKYDGNPFDSIRPEYILKNQNYNIDELHQLLRPGTYLIVEEGMGCCSYIRKNSLDELQGLFVHSDDWAYNQKKINDYQQFIRNFVKVNENNYIIHNWTGN